MSSAEVIDNKKVIAKNIVFLLNLRGKSRKEVCKDLDFKYTTFCDWVNAKTYPRIESLEKMALYFGIQVCDFFIDFDNRKEYGEERIMAYATRLQELDLETASNFTDDQLRLLLKSGVRFRRKALEEYIKEAGPDKMIASGEHDWGNPVGDETW